MRSQKFFDKYGIDVKTGSVVEGVRYDNQELIMKGGEVIKYDKLLLATVLYNKNFRAQLQTGPRLVDLTSQMSSLSELSKMFFKSKTLQQTQRILLSLDLLLLDLKVQHH